jgi:hypothetical protein
VVLFYPDYVYGMRSVEILLTNNYKGQLCILSGSKWADVEQLTTVPTFFYPDM